MKRINTERDDTIRKLYKKGNGAMLGRWWNISRQRVWQIRHDTHQTHQNRNLWGLIRKVIGSIGRKI